MFELDAIIALTIANQEAIRFMTLYTVWTRRTNLRPMLCPDSRIWPEWAIAYVAAKNDPFSHRRRWLINSGSASGTSVSPMALFTYLRTLWKIVQCQDRMIIAVETMLTNSSWFSPRARNIEFAGGMCCKRSIQLKWLMKGSTHDLSQVYRKGRSYVIEERIWSTYTCS